MNAALFANTAWMDEELLMFRYLLVGLVDEHVRVAQVVPESLSKADTSAFSERITWRDTTWKWLRKRRLLEHVPRLESLEVDLVHALDGRMWEGVAAIARRLNVPAVFRASSSLDISPSAAVAQLCVEGRGAIAAASAPLAQAIRRRLPSEATVEVITSGIPVRRDNLTPRTIDESTPLCLIVSGNGVYDAEYEALLRALRMIVTDFPQTQFFLDGQGGDQHELWKAARRLGLLANANVVARRLGHREMLFSADGFVHPQPLGRTRTLVLQAMAQGVPIIARTDPWLDYFVDGESAWMVDRPDAVVWADRLRRLITAPAAAHQLALSAREYVRTHHAPSHQVELTLDLYKRMAGEAIPFPGS